MPAIFELLKRGASFPDLKVKGPRSIKKLKLSQRTCDCRYLSINNIHNAKTVSWFEKTGQ